MSGALTKAPRRSRPPSDRRAPGVLVLTALATAGLAVAVQQSMVIPLLPTLMTRFEVSMTAVTWVFTASLLAGAVATPLLTRFGDMYGKRRMILLCLAMLFAGSVVCALSTTLAVLIAGRALQGVSVAMIPLAIGSIRDAFPPERVTTAIGVLSATMGVGGTLGMIVTGLIADRTPSHAPVFWISALLAITVLVLIARSAPESGQRAGGRPDAPGALLLAACLVCLLLAISQGNRWGWSSAAVAGLFAAAAVLGAIWVAVELRVSAPLVKMDLLVGRRSMPANIASLLLGFSMYAMFTLIAGFIQAPRETVGYGMSGSVLDVGLYMLPSTVTMLVSSTLSGRVSARLGPALTLAAGSLVAALSYGWIAVANAHAYDMLVFTALQGAGFGIAYAALGTLAVQHVPMDQSGIASGINALVRTTGGSIAGAATAAVLAASTIAGTSVPTLHAYVVCFWIGALGALLAAAVALYSALRDRRA